MIDDAWAVWKQKFDSDIYVYGIVATAELLRLLLSFMKNL